MNFMFQHRRTLSLATLVGFLLAGAVPSASAYYYPALGRYLSPDPNGQAILLQPGLPYHAANPMVTVNAAYQLQYGDGMSFYEYLRSNPAGFKDPAGLNSLPELTVTQKTSAYLRAAQFASFGALAVGSTGGIRAGYEAYLNGESTRDVALSALGGFNSTLSQPEIMARMLLASAIIGMSGPGGLAALAGLGVIESIPAHVEARAAQESATTQPEVDLATFDSILTGVGLVANVSATAAGLSAIGPLKQLRYRGRAPRDLKEQLALDEAAAGAGDLIADMGPLRDPGLQAVKRGTWRKVQHEHIFGDGSKIVIHTSRHMETGLVWDIKIKWPP